MVRSPLVFQPDLSLFCNVLLENKKVMDLLQTSVTDEITYQKGYLSVSYRDAQLYV